MKKVFVFVLLNFLIISSAGAIKQRTCYIKTKEWAVEDEWTLDDLEGLSDTELYDEVANNTDISKPDKLLLKRYIRGVRSALSKYLVKLDGVKEAEKFLDKLKKSDYTNEEILEIIFNLYNDPDYWSDPNNV